MLRAGQRCPVSPMKVHRRPSRSQTAHFTAAGTWRASVGASARVARISRATGTRASRRGELLLLEMGSEELERTIEHQDDLVRRILMAHQQPRVLKEVVGLLIEGDLEPKALRLQRRHLLSR